MESFDQIGTNALQGRITLPEGKLPDSQARLYKMIDYAKDRFHWYEDQREKKLGLAIGMASLSGVSLSMIFTSAAGKGIDPASWQFRLLCVIQLLLALTAFGVVVTYLRGQNLIYTHRKGLNDIFSWYNYGVPQIKEVSLFEYYIFGRFSDLTLTSERDPTLGEKRLSSLRDIPNSLRKWYRALLILIWQPQKIFSRFTFCRYFKSSRGIIFDVWFLACSWVGLLSLF